MHLDIIKNSYLVLGLLLLASRPLLASQVEINNPRAPEAAPVARVMAAYLDIHNRSGKDYRITEIHSPQFSKVEIHSMSHKDGMMIMKKQENLLLPAGKTISLQPGGFHMMLYKPRKWFQAGDNLELTITMDNSEQLVIKVPVIKDQGENLHHH